MALSKQTATSVEAYLVYLSWGLLRCEAPANKRRAISHSPSRLHNCSKASVRKMFADGAQSVWSLNTSQNNMSVSHSKALTKKQSGQVATKRLAMQARTAP